VESHAIDTGTIWEQFSSDLRRFIRRRVSDDHVADDLLQETFLRVHTGLPRLADGDRLVAWVYRIARNVLVDFHRRANSGSNLAEPALELAEPSGSTK
jgi:RNA polymerase sigma-70 factor (ECF subfamily)